MAIRAPDGAHKRVFSLKRNEIKSKNTLFFIFINVILILIRRINRNSIFSLVTCLFRQMYINGFQIMALLAKRTGATVHSMWMCWV